VAKKSERCSISYLCYQRLSIDMKKSFFFLRFKSDWKWLKPSLSSVIQAMITLFL